MAKNTANAANKVAPETKGNDKPEAPKRPTATVPSGIVAAAKQGELSPAQRAAIETPYPTSDGASRSNATIIAYTPCTHDAGEAMANINGVIKNIADASRTINVGLFARLIGPVADLLYFLKVDSGGKMPSEKAFKATIREHITKPMREGDAASFKVSESNVSNAITGAYRVAMMHLEPKPKAPTIGFHWFAPNTFAPIRFFWKDGEGKEHSAFASTFNEAKDTLTANGGTANINPMLLPTVPHNALYPKNQDGRTNNETTTPFPLSLNMVNKVWKFYEYKSDDGAANIQPRHNANKEAVKAARDAIGKLGLADTLAGLNDMVNDPAVKLEAHDRTGLLVTADTLVKRIHKTGAKMDKATARAAWSLMATLQGCFRIDDDGDFYLVDDGKETKLDIAETN